MSDADDALAATAVGLNEEAKAKRRKRGPTLSEALAESRVHLGGDGDGPADELTGDGSGQALPEADDTEKLGDALASLGEAVDQRGEPEDRTDLSEGAHVLAIDRMRNMATEAVVTDRALISFVRDFLLDQIKSRPKPWSGTSEGEKRDVAAAAEHAAHELVRKIAEAVASEGRPSVRVLLTKINLGEDIVIAGKVKTFEESETDDAVQLLHHARGKHVLLIPATADDYRGGGEPEIERDEPELSFEAGSDAPAGDADLNPDDDESEDDADRDDAPGEEV